MKIGLIGELLHVEAVAAVKDALSRMAPDIEWVHDAVQKDATQLRLEGDACYPFKKMVAGAVSLASRVDALLVPRIIRLDDYLMCPNFRALPDMVRLSLERTGVPERTLLLTLEIDASGPVDAACLAAGVFNRLFGAPPMTPSGINRTAASCIDEFRDKDISAAIALIGHPYVLMDPRLNNGVPDLLHRLGHETVCSRDIAFKTLSSLAGRHDFFAKTLYWRSAREVLGAFIYFLEVRRPAGIIQLVPFNCGVDALLRIELASLHKRMQNPVPYMVIVCDAHTQRDHVLTRVEAFLDMVHGITLN